MIVKLFLRHALHAKLYLCFRPDPNNPINRRLLILSAFGSHQRRVTADLAARRNEFVTALADEAWFAHITPGGELERLSKRAAEWADRPPRGC